MRRCRRKCGTTDPSVRDPRARLVTTTVSPIRPQAGLPRQSEVRGGGGVRGGDRLVLDSGTGLPVLRGLNRHRGPAIPRSPRERDGCAWAGPTLSMRIVASCNSFRAHGHLTCGRVPNRLRHCPSERVPDRHRGRRAFRNPAPPSPRSSPSMRLSAAKAIPASSWSARNALPSSTSAADRRRRTSSVSSPRVGSSCRPATACRTRRGGSRSRRRASRRSSGPS